MMKRLGLLVCAAALAGCARQVAEVYQTAPPVLGSEMHVATGAASNPDPYVAGRLAAEALKRRLIKPPHAVIVSECFDDLAKKQKAISGVCSVFPRQVVFGGATYGSFTQSGATDRDSVALLGIGGEGIAVAAALERGLGTARLSAEKDQAEIRQRLLAAGARLANKLPGKHASGLLIVIADAHSPKNTPLVEGIQQVLTREFPITGGSVNKNAGQTYVCYQGRLYEDSALALLLTGDFKVCTVGRQAKETAAVVATAEEAAREAHAKAPSKPFAALAFDCAGRKGKLASPDDELRAIRKALPEYVPLFGCYCAGEIGPPHGSEPNAPSAGVGWHIMFTLLTR